MGKFKTNAREWRRIRIQHEESSHSSTCVFVKIAPSDEAFGIVHNSCRLKLETNIDIFSQRYGIKHDVDESAAESELREQSMVHSEKYNSILFEFKT